MSEMEVDTVDASVGAANSSSLQSTVIESETAQIGSAPLASPAKPGFRILSESEVAPLLLFSDAIKREAEMETRHQDDSVVPSAHPSGSESPNCLHRPPVVHTDSIAEAANCLLSFQTLSPQERASLDSVFSANRRRKAEDHKRSHVGSIRTQRVGTRELINLQTTIHELPTSLATVNTADDETHSAVPLSEELDYPPTYRGRAAARRSLRSDDTRPVPKKKPVIKRGRRGGDSEESEFGGDSASESEGPRSDSDGMRQTRSAGKNRRKRSPPPPLSTQADDQDGAHQPQDEETPSAAATADDMAVDSGESFAPAALSIPVEPDTAATAGAEPSSEPEQTPPKRPKTQKRSKKDRSPLSASAADSTAQLTTTTAVEPAARSSGRPRKTASVTPAAAAVAAAVTTPKGKTSSPQTSSSATRKTRPRTTPTSAKSKLASPDSTTPRLSARDRAEQRQLEIVLALSMQ
eukprot:TRINITY_DN5680_c0_g2_i1.p1 TRINITY_DN5680_c0_g2~~TRINITY_DN5680_c0_g2_i1.p1  ORF type:complete len:465 (+),score=85.10 TRINITY_DN5680_c0_g2_i1:159-1553(+)